MGDVTLLLGAMSRGDAAARDRLFGLVYGELMGLARGHLSRAGTVSLDPTALLHEASLRLLEAGRAAPASRKLFFGYASAVMRNVVVDYVRARSAGKRGGGQRAVTLDTARGLEMPDHRSVVDLDEALAALERVDGRASRVVTLRYFGGLSEGEVAEQLSISVPTVKRDWRKARAFLFDYLGR
jgi:RNA polymerase sigma factor (TIGR02999 family)